MKKEEIIRLYGEEEYKRRLEHSRIWREAHKEQEKVRTKKYYEDHKEQVKEAVKKYQEEHPEEESARYKKYQEEHPEEVIAHNQEIHRKGGKYYEKHLIDSQTGIPGDKNKIRNKHAKQYRPYKKIIAPDSQLHHEWIPDTSEYRGVALVEADQHMHGIVDVIEILDGEITLLTEEEIRNGKKKKPKL